MNITTAFENFRQSILGALRQYRHNDDNTGPIWAPEQGFVAGYDKQEVDRAIALLQSSIRQTKPTHYAVIDEHGEIVQAFKILQYREAENDCYKLINALAGTVLGTNMKSKDWTVKGVTVHE